MKKLILILPLSLGIWSCKENTTESKEINTAKNNPAKVITAWDIPASGIVVSEYKQEVKTSIRSVGATYFKVVVKSTDQSKEGVFNIDFAIGQNLQSKEMKFPIWDDGHVVRPIVQKDDTQENVINIGFDIGDGKFNELYQVTANGLDIGFKQVKGYYPLGTK